MVDGWPDAIRAVAEAVIAVCAAYAAYRGHLNGVGQVQLKEKLEANPRETVQEMVKANGPLSGSFPKCGFVPMAQMLEPGESPKRTGV